MRNSKIFSKAAAWLIILCMFLSVRCGSETSETEASQQTNSDVEQRLKELGVKLRKPSPPTANFVRAVRTGNLVFLAGHGPSKPECGVVTGKVGRDLNLDQAKEAARLSAISLLSSLKAEIGDLNKVKRIVKVHGMVNAVPDFTQHSQVMNGCSDFLVSVFGQRGKHARAAVGMGSLPRNMAVEIEMIVEVE
jgi:enamine deaminase RidA (YjgF/YER057c/UK114 family)